MAEEVPELKKDSTMIVTAKEGEAFLETKGKVHEDAKTRAQQKELEEGEDNENSDDEASPNKLSRTTTMAATAQEGSELLGDEELGKTRAETENLKEKGENGADEENGNDDSEGENEEDELEVEEKPGVKREGTMAVTAAEGAALLVGHDTESGTRAEAKAVKEALDESVEQNGEKQDEEKPDLKRKSTMATTIEEGEEYVKRKKESNGAEQEATA